MKQGIVQRQNLEAAQTVTASVALVDVTGFTVPVVAGGVYHFRIKGLFTVGATGGFKFRLDGPAAPTSYQNIQTVIDGVTASPGAQICDPITALADFANAFASVAGDHSFEMEGQFIPSIAGTLKLQFACNSAAGAITLARGMYFEITTL